MLKQQSEIKSFFVNHLKQLQNNICAALEKIDGSARFQEDLWDRPEGGGGRTRVIRNGNVFENGGVNISEVHGKLPESIKESFGVDHNNFFATGISIVLHPINPYVPTSHCNYRMFELYDDLGNTVRRWYGGGADLTPYYLFEEDAIHFHTSLKHSLDQYDEQYYPDYKRACDEYFVNHHRNGETRGIGGIFYDYLAGDSSNWKDILEMHILNSETFIHAYLPIVERRKNHKFTNKEKNWQEIRRGRYVEFNLIHDKGTLFGLKTNGRTESILMSLPAKVQWQYNYQIAEGSDEEKLVRHLKPIDWINYSTKAT